MIISSKIFNNIKSYYTSNKTPLIFNISDNMFPADVFEKNFATVETTKKEILNKFANIEENSKLIYKIWDLKNLETYSKSILEMFLPIATAKNKFNQLRFTPEELLTILNQPQQTLELLGKAASQKTSNNLFAYSYDDLIKLSKYDKNCIINASQLIDYNLTPQSFMKLCKHAHIDCKNIKKRLDVIKKLYPNNIKNLVVIKDKDSYVIKFTKLSNNTLKVFHFNKNFKPRKPCNIDFEKGEFKQKTVFDKLIKLIDKIFI